MTENELMLTTILNCQRIDLYVDPQPLAQAQQQKFQDFQSRREKGEPLQYILGETDFLGCPLKVDPRVLIPRPETEVLVSAVLEYSPRIFSNPIHILDVGTGSGNISIALAKHLAQSQITAVDFSQGCLDLASWNATMNSVSDRIQFIQSDVFSALPRADFPQRFDILVSNPPYIPSGEIDALPFDVCCEPRSALDGGADGLDFYRRIFAEASLYLKSGALMFLEIGSSQLEDLRQMLRGYPDLALIEVRKDLCLRDRVLILRVNSITPG